MIRRLQMVVANGYLVKFLVVGGASFAIDLGLLALLHEVGGVDLWIATPIAFLVSLVFNFLVQRKFTFQSSGRADVSLLKYCALVVFNVIATDVVVIVVDGAGYPYALGKVIATIATTVWNFLLYKHWIFKSPRRNDGAADARDESGAPVPEPLPKD
ncbi:MULTISPECIES: GtrA family protein [Arthrobacter]|nr:MULTISPECIES: GtrA family protein [Arthrobacter]